MFEYNLDCTVLLYQSDMVVRERLEFVLQVGRNLR